MKELVKYIKKYWWLSLILVIICLFLILGDTCKQILITPTNRKINNITFVSGYWKVDNKHDNKFNEWFKNTLNVNENYIIYTRNEDLNLLKENRRKFKNKTIFKIKNIEDFYTYKLNIQNKTNPTHVPSKELGLIWLEKINLVNETSKENPYNSEWFCWIDSAIVTLRDRQTSKPLSISNLEWVNKLDKNKINYTSSENDKVTDNWREYKHDVAGGAFIIHKSKTQFYRDIFYNYLNDCLKNCKDYMCYSDQIIFSKLKLNHPEYFNKICDGYGCIVK